MTLDIEQDSKIAHSQAIRGLGLVQAFDVSMQSVLQPFNLAENLGAFARGQRVEVIQRWSAVFDLIARAIHSRTQTEYAVRPKISILIKAKMAPVNGRPIEGAAKSDSKKLAWVARLRQEGNHNEIWSSTVGPSATPDFRTGLLNPSENRASLGLSCRMYCQLGKRGSWIPRR